MIVVAVVVVVVLVGCSNQMPAYTMRAPPPPPQLVPALFCAPSPSCNLAGLGEHVLRDMNDSINKLLREKGHWQKRIKDLVRLYLGVLVFAVFLRTVCPLRRTSGSNCCNALLLLSILFAPLCPFRRLPSSFMSFLLPVLFSFLSSLSLA